MCILYAYVYISRFELNHPKHGYLSFEPPTSRNFSGLLTPQQLTPRSFLRLHGRSVRTGPCHEFLTVSAQLSGYQFRRVCAETKKLCKKKKNMRSVFDTEIRGWFFLKTLSDPWKLRIVAYYSAKLSLPGTLICSCFASRVVNLWKPYYGIPGLPYNQLCMECVLQQQYLGRTAWQKETNLKALRQHGPLIRLE